MEWLRPGRACSASACRHAAEVLADMETSQVSIFAVEVQQNELLSRRQMTDVVNRRRMRHAHMVNITPQIMMEGMRADFLAVDRLSQRVLERASKPPRSAPLRLRARTSAQSSTPVTNGSRPAASSALTSGATCPGARSSRLPAKSMAPSSWMASWAITSASATVPSLPTPMTITIAKNRIVACTSSNSQLQDDFWEYTHRDENSDRVGEFAIGTNIGVTRVIGNILQDEKFPGIHIAFGDPYGEHTGAKWSSSTHIDVVGLGFNIWLESASGDEQIMREGRFLIQS